MRLFLRHPVLPYLTLSRVYNNFRFLATILRGSFFCPIPHVYVLLQLETSHVHLPFIHRFGIILYLQLCMYDHVYFFHIQLFCFCVIVYVYLRCCAQYARDDFELVIFFSMPPCVSVHVTVTLFVTVYAFVSVRSHPETA